MGMMDKFLNIMRLNADEEEDFYDDDYYDDDDDDDYYEEPKRKSFRREKAQPEEDPAIKFSAAKEQKASAKSNSKVTPMQSIKKESGRKCCYGSMCDQTYICGGCPRNY